MANSADVRPSRPSLPDLDDGRARRGSPTAVDVGVATSAIAASIALDAMAPEAALRALPIGVLIEGEPGLSWMNEELARLWRRPDRPPPRMAELEEALERMPASSGADGWHALLSAPARTSRWRRRVLRRPDGTGVPVRVSRRPIAGGPGVVYEATYVLEEVTREPEARLRQAFLAMVGHELRTPITSVVAGAELLQSGHLDDQAHDEVAGLVVEEANRIHMLVEQLTALTMLQSSGSAMASEPVHLVNVARRIGAREAARRPALQVRLPKFDSTIPVALGDEGFIAQVLTILIDNAAKHGGATPSVEIDVRPTGSTVAVHILDCGPGLQGTDPERLFALYQRAVPDGGSAGSGIGLYVARQIVTAMNGRIWARDRDGGGADFGFELPVAR